MTEHKNAELARHAFDALNSGDRAVIRQYLHEDVVFTMPGSSPAVGLPNAVIRGLPALLSAFENVGQFTQGLFRFSVQSVLADANGAAVVSHNTARRGAKSLDLRMVLLLRIEDNKVVAITEFPQQAQDWVNFWTEGGE